LLHPGIEPRLLGRPVLSLLAIPTDLFLLPAMYTYLYKVSRELRGIGGFRKKKYEIGRDEPSYKDGYNS
jgi:hypothetical protein